MPNEPPPDGLLLDYPLVIDLPVQWGDQDAFGHVNNTVHLRWFESARIAYLERGGLSHLMNSTALGVIVASVTCHYRRQITYPDTISVSARVGRLGRSSMTIEHLVMSHAQGVIAADGESVVVVFDYQAQRPRRIPAEMQDAIDRFEAGRESRGA
jgi:acyl-CoA thioester hydrolase